MDRKRMAKVTAVKGDLEQATLKGGGKKFRLQIDFSGEAYEELVNLQKLLNAPSKAEVIRDAIGVLRWAVDEIRNDNRILVEKKRGEEGNKLKEILFHFINRSPEKTVTS